MASLITVRLDKGGSSSLGFRLQGGKDFGTPLVIQKVNGGSPAERAGLLAGDSVIKINNTDVFNLRHKDAQDVIIRAGPAFEVTIQRGGSVWKPAVIPTGQLHSTSSISPVTKTSLAANKKDNIGSIGTGHNLAAKPFSSPQLNGAVNGGPKIVNKQYNSPLKLYSEENIAETISAQTEVLSTGALGVNFKKNERNYDASNSAVFRMLQEAENEPKTPEAEPETTVVPSAITGLRHVSAPESRPAPANPQLPPGQNICADCERLIVGVFVRIKDKNLHVECFKCSTCGTSLKNVGYYNINNKLYCDVHAKLAARTNPPAPNLVPITVPPGGRPPVSAISSALASHSLPSPSPLSPKTNLAQPFQAGNYSTTPKPFSSVSAPLPSQSFNTLPKTAPLSPVASAPLPSYSPVSATGRSVQSVVWPPLPEEPEVPTACPIYVPPPSHIKVNPKTIKHCDIEYSDTTSESRDYEFDETIMAQYQEPKLSLCSEEVCGITGRRSAVECVETISESLETQKLVENVLKNKPFNRPLSPPPVDQDIIISQNSRASEMHASQESYSMTSVSSKESADTSELKRLTDFKPNTVECKLKSQVENVVPHQWESQMVQALRTVPDLSSQNTDTFAQIPKKYSSSSLASALSIAPSEPFTTQPATCLAPIPLPEETVPYFPPEHPIVIEPKEPAPPKPDSKFVKALQTAPERPFTPVGAVSVKKKKNPEDEFFKDLPKPQCKLTMRDALMTASDRPYSPLPIRSESVQIDSQSVEATTVEKKHLEKHLKPAALPTSFQKPLMEDKPQAPKPFPITVHETKEKKQEEKQIDVQKSTTVKKHQVQSTTEKAVESADEDRVQGMYPLFKGFSCSFGNKSEHSEFSIEISTTPPLINLGRSLTPNVKISRTGESSETTTETVTEKSQIREKSTQETQQHIIEKQAEQVVLKKPLPLTSTLHKPEGLPQYQVNLSESIEADLQLMQKVEAAQIRHEQQKSIATPPSKPPREFPTKPIITVQPGESKLQPEQSFKPVSEDRPASSTFSPRPRAVTPSMINKPPPTIPYYQASLVAQQYRAPEVNLLDPTSPAISRSPSPCPERKRSPSPFLSPAANAVRPKSPAAGPPPNPLRSGKPLPTPRDAKIEEAKKNVASYIPQYKSRMDVVEKTETVAPQIYVAHAETQNVYEQQLQQRMANAQQSLQIDSGKKLMMSENRQIEDTMQTQVMSKQAGQAVVSTAISEKSHLDHLEQMRASQSQSVEQSSDGRVQVQRKKTVTEEFEHTQKSKMVQIEQNVSTSRTHPFKNVKNPVIEEHGIIGLHVTNPQPISSPFLKAGPSQPCSIPLPKVQPLPKQPPPQPQQPPPQRQQPQSQACQVPKPSSVKHVPAPSLTSPIKHVSAPSGSAKKPNQSVNRSNIPVPNAGAGSGSGGGRQAGAVGVAPKRGRGVLNTAALGGTRIPLCASCHSQIRGPFITALGKIWCPDHFICATPSCRRPLQDLGFVEEQGQLYCEYCFEQYLAPPCSKCSAKIKGDCLKAIGKNFHPECFNCVYCGKLFGNSPFFLEDGNPYCDTDWNELFTTKCFACGFPVEAGDRWVEALNNNYHSQCFNCTMCKKNLEGQSFFAKGGRPFCKNHAR